jgi:hypothetical protein
MEAMESVTSFDNLEETLEKKIMLSWLPSTEEDLEEVIFCTPGLTKNGGVQVIYRFSDNTIEHCWDWQLAARQPEPAITFPSPSMIFLEDELGRSIFQLDILYEKKWKNLATWPGESATASIYLSVCHPDGREVERPFLGHFIGPVGQNRNQNPIFLQTNPAKYGGVCFIKMHDRGIFCPPWRA